MKRIINTLLFAILTLPIKAEPILTEFQILGLCNVINKIKGLPGFTRVHARQFEILPLPYFSTPKHTFFDPADTRVAIYAALEAARADNSVLVLGSGSGAEAAVIAKSVRQVHGLDISEDSVAHASKTYAADNLTFSVSDFLHLETDALAKLLPTGFIPNILAVNPPYVPSVTPTSNAAMYGGETGLRYLPAIIKHAKNFSVSRIALTIGSYSSPRQALKALAENDYHLISMTLSAIPFGQFSTANAQRIFELENERLSILWRDSEGNPGYIIMGMTFQRAAFPLAMTKMIPGEIIDFLRLAASSKTLEIEKVTPENTPKIRIRIVVN